jgi:uroporphyrinogen decarboxylase
MHKRERVQAALQGTPVDRPPISCWRHFFEKEASAAGLAEAMLGFQRTYDWDFMKVNPRACDHADPWGGRCPLSGQPDMGPKLLEAAVKAPDDWRQIRPVSPTTGAFGEQ